MALPVLTASRLRDARSCQRLHKLKYLDGYRPAEDAATLSFGKLVHLGLEAWWSCTAPQDRLGAAFAALTGDADPFDMARARAMLTGYDTRWGDQVMKVVGVEVEFQTEMHNPETGAASRTWALAGKIDAIAELPDGRLMLVEHKTSSEDIAPGSSYWARLRLDSQISIYYEGARSLGLDVQGCIYDVLGKPALRPLKVNQKRKVDETPAEFFARCAEAIATEPNAYLQRGEVVRLEAEMSEAMADVWQMGRMLRENEIAERFPRNVDSCFKFGRACPFWAACSGEASLDSPLYRRSENVHPELELGAASAA